MAGVRNLEILQKRQSVCFVPCCSMFYYEKFRYTTLSRFFSVTVYMKHRLLGLVWAHHRNVFFGLNLKYILMYCIINISFAIVTLILKMNLTLTINVFLDVIFLSEHMGGVKSPDASGQKVPLYFFVKNDSHFPFYFFYF